MGFKHVVAIVFAILATLLGVFFALNAFSFYIRSLHERTTGDANYFRQNAAQMFACAIVLIVPAIWYGRVGLRGDASRR